LVQDQLEREREEGLLSKGRIGQRLSGMRQTQQAISPAPFAITGPRAFDLGRSRVIGLAPAQLEALVNLSKLGTMPMRRAGQLVGFDTLGALMRGGHVVPDSADRDFVYSLAADAASGAAVADPDGVQRLADRMVETILEDSASGLQMSSLEAMFVATVLEHRPLQEMHKYRERYGNSALGHVHIVAAGQASASGLFHDALGHARRAERLNPVLPAYIEMAKALANMGQHSAARAALERGRDYCAARPDDLNWLRWVIRLRSAENHEHINDLCAQAVGWHPGDATFAAECTLASLVVYSSAAARLPAVREIVDDNRVDTLTRLKACGYLALNSAYAGQSVGVVYACAAAIEFEEVHYDDQYDQLSLREMAVLVFAQIGTAQVMTRTDLNQLGHHIERRMSSAVKHHDYSYVAPLGATLGYLASERGDFLQAELELRRAAERYTGTDPGWRKAWAGCLHVSVLASLGRVHEAQRGLADIRHPSKPETSWYSYAYFSAEMALHKARGRYDEAREIALNLANAGQWSPLIQVEQLFAASALGEPAKHVASVAAEAAHSTTSQSLIAMADFLVAKEREDAEAAYESGNRLAELRMPEAAQVAFDYAAQRFSTIGDKRQAKEALTRANGLVDAMCGQPPASTREFDFSALSGREVEIAQLVAAGRTNREIAEQLFLSVRTVESHVYRVLRKLQVATRRELLECMVSG
ncbi:MAG TPA: helix-turn-helix transcriptional regulator, partial [Glaciihabitans sp.]|nr:helix-turn-helix transcriptional regulator [Glaciihabitans sp.]